MRRPRTPRIMRFRSEAKVDPAEVEALEPRLHAMDSNQLKQELKRFVPEYSPYLD